MGRSKQVHSGIIHAKHEFFCRFPMFSWIIFLIHAHFFLCRPSHGHRSLDSFAPLSGPQILTMRCSWNSVRAIVPTWRWTWPSFTRNGLVWVFLGSEDSGVTCHRAFMLTLRRLWTSPFFRPRFFWWWINASIAKYNDSRRHAYSSSRLGLGKRTRCGDLVRFVGILTTGKLISKSNSISSFTSWDDPFSLLLYSLASCCEIVKECRGHASEMPAKSL